ncbi:MAG: hypothetical protein RLZ56_148 [Bacteroidota bacterium]|jgi:transcriptional regulator with XRE-family HTH domain
MEGKSDNIARRMGQLLKFERMNQQITIAKIAMDLHLNPSTIVSIEDAKHQAHFITVYKIIEYLKIDPVVFFNGIRGEESLLS